MNVNRPKPHAKMHCFFAHGESKKDLFLQIFSFVFSGKQHAQSPCFSRRYSLVGRAAEIQRQGLLRLYERAVH